MTTTDWRSKVVLEAGETLNHEGTAVEGFMQETDIDTYSIVKGDGTVTGSVKVTDHTAVKGFKRTIRILQRDAAGRIVVEAIL